MAPLVLLGIHRLRGPVSAPTQVKAFARSLGTRAKTDRIEAELIVRFLIFRPDAGRVLPAEHFRLLRTLTSKLAQVVEMRKRLLAQNRAHGKSGTAELFEDIDGELKERLDFAIAELESRKPHKVMIIAVARKLVIIANALCKRLREWGPTQT